MFSCLEVCVVCLWCTLIADTALFRAILWVIPVSHAERYILQDEFIYHGGVLVPTIGIVLLCCALLLWFRHYLGQQLRRRMEKPPAAKDDFQLHDPRSVGTSSVSSRSRTVSLVSEFPVDEEKRLRDLFMSFDSTPPANRM